VSKSSKRERQRQNREARREYEEALHRRRRRLRTARNLAFFIVPVLVAGAVISVASGGDDAGAVTCKEVKKPPAKPVQLTAPPMGIDQNQSYVATMQTSCGTIELSLLAQDYPINVNNFVSLANQGVYDATAVLRVAKGGLVQGGSPNQTQEGGPGYTTQGEVPTAAKAYPVGTLAMAKTGTEPAATIGSQFFIVAGNVGKKFTPDYAVVGTITKGLNVAKKIASLYPPGVDPTTGSTNDGKPTQNVVVEKVTITTRGIVPPSTTPSS